MSLSISKTKVNLGPSGMGFGSKCLPGFTSHNLLIPQPNAYILQTSHNSITCKRQAVKNQTAYEGVRSLIARNLLIRGLQVRTFGQSLHTKPCTALEHPTKSEKREPVTY